MQTSMVMLAGCVTLMPVVAQNATSSRRGEDNAAREELAHLEEVWNQAHQGGDTKALERIWADDLEVTVPQMPVLHKSELVEFVRSGRMKFLRYETSDLHIRIYGSSAIVSGRLQRKRTIGAREVEDDWRFTKVYVRSNEGWRVAAFHASDAPKP